MAQANPEFSKGDILFGHVASCIAEGAISKNQTLELGTAYPQMKTHTTTQTTLICAIALEDADSGDLLPILVFGPIKLVISDSGGITRGQLVTASTATAGSCTSQAYADGTTLHGALGIALDTADAAGELVPVICGWPGIVSNA
jgi:hypothetical protein